MSMNLWDLLLFRLMYMFLVLVHLLLPFTILLHLCPDQLVTHLHYNESIFSIIYVCMFYLDDNIIIKNNKKFIINGMISKIIILCSFLLFYFVITRKKLTMPLYLTPN